LKEATAEIIPTRTKIIKKDATTMARSEAKNAFQKIFIDETCLIF
jgi:hypothetical protein